MTPKKQITIRVDKNLYELVRYKCNQKLGIGVTPLLQIFLRAFVSQKGVGFYVGDDDLCDLFYRWLGKKKMQQGRSKNNAPLPGPRLKDLYALNDTPDERRKIQTFWNQVS